MHMAFSSTGHFTWHELLTTDAVAATKFYTGLFGWTVQEMPAGPTGTYLLWKQGDVGVGGAMTAPPGVPSHWLPYVGVENADESVKSVTAHGGKILVPPTTIPDMLRFAIATDTGGAAIGLMQPMGPTPPAYEGPSRPGTFVWDELHTRDQEGSKKFYGTLFGWTGKAGEGDMAYWHWRSGTKDIGGMMEAMGGPKVPPHWLGYIAVSDVDAMTKKVETLGGKVVMPAMDMPNVGKFSIVQDPTGAVFSLFRSARV
jgi:predicted enzyme related to lactoylglutathione lyase